MNTLISTYIDFFDFFEEQKHTQFLSNQTKTYIDFFASSQFLSNQTKAKNKSQFTNELR